MNAEHLLELDVTPAMVIEADRFANKAIYTTTAIAALAQFHDENGDEEGAAMLRRFAAEFAGYEAKSL